jgi:FAD/FMN-containing dehydrogenase
MSSLSTFKQSFKGDVVTPDDADYTEAIARWAANAQRPARVVAFVKDTDDIALALKYARTNGLQVAIRCGGHSPAGASSAKDGLVIDLSRHLNYAAVDPEKRTVRVGGGTLWGTVEKEAIQHGLATVAGTVNHVRVVSLRLALHEVLTMIQTGVSGVPAAMCSRSVARWG